MKNLVTLFVILSVTLSLTWALNSPLENFVEKPDQGWSYTLNKTLVFPGYSIHILNFTSINWLTSSESNHPRWWHWLSICVPTEVYSKDGFLYVDGGKYDTNVDAPHAVLVKLCSTSNSIVSHLHNNPNQPLVLDNDGISRTEDDIIAYTWKKYIDNRNLTDWIGQFAETKATVRAFDAIQAFVKATTPYRVKNFVVAGESKRGWASWLAAAVDTRVKAVIPIVMPILNIIENTNAHFKAYGGWSFTYDDYFEQGIMTHLNKEPFEALAKLVDPIRFVEQLTVPKYVVNAAGDQYFLPDSATFFWKDLLGQKHLRIHPNGDHYIIKSRKAQLVNEIDTYYNNIINKGKMPNFEWSIIPDPTTNTTNMFVNIDNKHNELKNIVVYFADTVSKTQRDWRWTTCGTSACFQGIYWNPLPVIKLDDNLYKYTITPPVAGGWRGAFFELTFESPYGDLVYTSDFGYAPYILPFQSCGQDCQNQPFPV
ncbi:hypothetical protein CYY_008600 [Polysphondylium violaceum]|uniref:PhoPQ-activated pathogenicity-related protein n=1 Tax=Polysphondylium violaceum TaxID=133409 RepID=A0A8J4PMQ8_9MYCE|nr:hypothetical protein CYY_008600 [Polysphondylium violaceum]